MVTAKREQRYPQLQMVRLGADFAWILDAVDRQPEGRSGAIRSLLHEVLGKRGAASLEILCHEQAEACRVTLPPVRIVAGYEHLPEAIEATRERASARLKRTVDRADVIRSALWKGLRLRGVAVPEKPLDLYRIVRANPHKLHSQIARELGLSSWKVVARMRETMGIQPTPEQLAMKRRLTPDELERVLDEGIPQVQIAEHLGISQKTVSVRRKQAWESFRGEMARLSNKEIALAIDLSLTQTEAAKKLGVSQKTISVLRKKAREKK
jgi:DNA-binding CsgD family transcriptional regulator